MSNTRYNEVLCRNEQFWREKFIKDYGPVTWTGSWKELYRGYNNVWIFGLFTRLQLDPNNRGLVPEAILDHYPFEASLTVPAEIPEMKAIQVSSGDLYTMMIDANHNIFGLGMNEHGELGVEGLRYYTTPVQIPNFKALQISAGSQHTVFIDLEHNVWSCGYNSRDRLGLSDSTISKPNRYQLGDPSP